MNIIFMGTPDFAVPCLDMLNHSDHCILGVFTQPDRPNGRGNKIRFSAVKSYCLENEISFFQPYSLKNEESIKLIKDLNPDLIVVVAYGNLLPQTVLEIPRLGCVNVHGSLLPKYRGAAPIQWAVLNGDSVTGVTTMMMDKGLDTGDIILKREISVLPDETSGELFNRISQISPDVLKDTINLINNGSVTTEKQDDSISSYAPMLDKTFSPIDWSKSSFEIHNQIRGLNPWPVATTVVNNKKLKIYKSEICNFSSDIPGTVLKSDGELIISCIDKAIRIDILQLEGKKVLSASDFLRGFKIPVGTVIN